MKILSKCPACGREALVSRAVGVCAECVRSCPEGSVPSVRAVRERSRRHFGLPPAVPCAAEGAGCHMCGNRCVIPEGELGFCGLRRNQKGRIRVEAGRPDTGLVDWYHDPLPTNCVAAWVCPGCAEAGFPAFSFSRGPEYGYKNLAVFYRSCTFDCLFCQNWHFREARSAGGFRTAEELAGAVDPTTSCVCFFGGDPSSQMSHALQASRLARAKTSSRILRICFETNGNMSPHSLDRALALCLESGGCMKFDVKAHSPALHRALTGTSNRIPLENLKRASLRARERPDPPLVVASTLLVPGYVEAREVRAIGETLADVDRSIPYALLAFAPMFLMSDLPPTSRRQAEACLKAAKAAGLERVELANTHLLV